MIYKTKNGRELAIEMVNEITNENDKKKFKQAIMLYINQKLFNDNIITEDMYYKAKDLILRKIA